MTYFGFLIRFIGVPLLILAGMTLWDARRGRRVPESLQGMPGWFAILAHIIAAVVWTTPWDNYLVATGVWYYNPDLVTGITLGWVPIEEYIFFVVQTLLTGLWVLWLARHLKPAPTPIPHRPRLRTISAAVVGVIVIAAWAAFFSGWSPATYLALEVGWLLIPVIPQMLAGGDALWHNRRLVLLGLLPPWLYLSVVDSFAISAGTWTIAPSQSTRIMIGGVLPVEEFIFFGLTNMLIVFGMVLFLATDNVAVKRWSRRVFGNKPYLEKRGTERGTA
jgi:lycopene cyclase domain-containing protein